MVFSFLLIIQLYLISPAQQAVQQVHVEVNKVRTKSFTKL